MTSFNLENLFLTYENSIFKVSKNVNNDDFACQ